MFFGETTRNQTTDRHGYGRNNLRMNKCSSRAELSFMSIVCISSFWHLQMLYLQWITPLVVSKTIRKRFWNNNMQWWCFGNKIFYVWTSKNQKLIIFGRLQKSIFEQLYTISLVLTRRPAKPLIVAGLFFLKFLELEPRVLLDQIISLGVYLWK
jgi:hypothetical protein